MNINNCGLIGLDDTTPIKKIFTDFLYNLTISDPKEIMHSFLREKLVPYITETYNRRLEPHELLTLGGALKDQVAGIDAAFDFLDNLTPEAKILLEGALEDLPKEITNLVENVYKIPDNGALDQLLNIHFNSSASNDVTNKSETLNTSPSTEEGMLSKSNGFVEDRLIDLDIRLSNPSDIDNLYAGANNAQIWLERNVKSAILTNFLVDRKEDTYNLSSAKIDQSIKAYKEGVYKELYNYMTQQQPELQDRFSEELYVDINGALITTIDFRDFLKTVANYYKRQDLTNTKLNNWAIKDKEDIRQFSNFILLSNFDNLLLSLSANVFKIPDSLYNSDLETKGDLKYALSLESDASTGFTAFQTPLEESQSPVFKLLLESMAMVSGKGLLSKHKQVDLGTINATVARVFSDIRNFREQNKLVYDKTDAVHSIKDIFEYYIINKYKNAANFFTSSSTYASSEADVVLSLYLNYFRTSNDLENIVGKTLNEALNAPNPLYNGKSVLEEIGSSHYKLATNTDRAYSMDGPNYLNILVNNFNKSYRNDYMEIKYDGELKDLAVDILDTAFYEGDAIWFKNDMTTEANHSFSKEQLETLLDQVTVDLNSGDVMYDLSPTKKLLIKLAESGETGIQISENGTLRPVSALDNDLLTVAFGGEAYKRSLAKIIEDNIASLNIHSNDAVLSAIQNEFDPMGGSVGTIKILGRLAAASMYIKKLTSLEVANRTTVLEGSEFLKGSGKSLLNESRDEFKLTALHSTIGDNIDRVAKAFAAINGSMYRSVMKVASGENMPLYSESRHMYLLHDILDSIDHENSNLQKRNTLEGKQYIAAPLTDNFFVRNRKMIKTPMINTFVTNKNNTIHSADLSPKEIETGAIVHKFFGALKKFSDRVFIQPTVFTDKDTHYYLNIDMKEQVDLYPGCSKSLINATRDDIEQAMFFSNGSYYNNLGNRMLSAYELVFKELIPHFKEYNYYLMREAASDSSEPIMHQLEWINNHMKGISETDFRNTFYRVNNNKVGLIENLGIVKNQDGTIGLSKSILEYARIFSDPGKLRAILTSGKEAYTSYLKNIEFKFEFANNYRTTLENNKQIFDRLPGLLNSLEGSTKEQKVTNFINKWMAPSGYLILSKGTGETYEMNPLIENYYMHSTFLSMSHQTALMGTIHGNSDKGSSTFEGAVSNQVAGIAKRQLAGTPGNPINQGIINGSPNSIKTVTITNIKKPVHNSYGIVGTMTTDDGGVYTPMLQVILTNNSLQDKAVGTIQKTLGMAVDPFYNSFEQRKCAEHGLTNEMIRRSNGSQFDLKKLYKHAYGISLQVKRSEAEGFVYPNLLKDYNDRLIQVQHIAPNGLYFSEYNHLMNDYDIIEVKNITSESSNSLYMDNFSDNIYTFHYQNKNKLEDSEYTKTFKINNLYDLWCAIGAENSVSLHQEGALSDVSGSRYRHSDASHEALAGFVNKVGMWTTEDNVSDFEPKQHLEYFGDKRVIPDNIDRMPTQKEIWQPLKECFIGRYTNPESQKLGATSVVPIESVYNNSKEVSTIGDETTPEFDSTVRDHVFYKFNILSDHLLLTTDHPTDESQVTEMSQIMGALTFNAETFHVAKNTYNALASLVNIKLEKLLDGIKEFKESGNKDVLYAQVVKDLIHQFQAKNQQSIAPFLATLAKKYQDNINLRKKNGEHVDESISAYADIKMEGNVMPFSSYVYNSFISMVSSSINSSVIRRKHSGLAGPLKISAGYVQVYDVIKNGIPTVVTGDVFHNKYRVVQEERTPIGNIGLFDWVRTSFIDSDGQIVQKDMYIDEPQTLINFKIANAGQTVTKLYGKPRDLKPLEVKFVANGKTMSIYDTEEFVLAFTVRNLTSGRNRDKIAASLQSLTPEHLSTIKAQLASYLNFSNADLVNPKFYQKNKGIIDQVFKNSIQAVFRGIQATKTIKLKEGIFPVTDIQSFPGEALGPNIYRKAFGMPVGESMDNISEAYFKDILEKNGMPKTEESDMFIQRLDGKHIYIFSPERAAAFTNRFSGANKEISIVDGEKWLLDEYGDKEYFVGDLTFKKFITEQNEIVDAIILKDNNLEPIYKFLGENKENNTVSALKENTWQAREELWKQNDLRARHIYNSFDVAREFLAARIPGQGPQSFTALRIIDFSHESNAIMTNHFTTWLKGEDYDIDKGFWLGASIGKDGVLAGWSKRFDHSSINSLRLSLQLPIPGEVKVKDPDSINILSNQEILALETYKDTNVLTQESVDVLNKLSNYQTYKLETEKEGIDDFINDYFSEQIPQKELERAIKNKIARSSLDMITSIVNQVHAESPIDFGDAKDVAKTKTPPLFSEFNRGDISQIQDANMIGKKVIGAAAVGLKIWSALSFWGNTKMLEGKISDIVLQKVITLNGKVHYISTIPNLNFNNGKTFETFVSEVADILASRQEVKIDEFLKEMHYTYGLNVDQSLILSQILSAATDNAKELILAKINAGSKTAGVYLYGAMMGIPFKEIATLMTSDELQWIVKKSAGNIYEEGEFKVGDRKKITRAISLWKEGPSLFFAVNRNKEKANAIKSYYKKVLIDKMKLNKAQIKALNPADPKDTIDVMSIGALSKLFGTEYNYISSKSTSEIIGEVLDLYEENIPTKNLRKSMSQSDIEAMQETGEEVSEVSIPVKRDIIRFLEEARDFYETSFKTRTDTQRINVDSFEQLFTDSSEITTLGTSMLNINTGIKTDPYEQYQSFSNMDNFLFESLERGVPAMGGSDFLLKFIDLHKGALSEKHNVHPDVVEETFTEFMREPSYKRFLEEMDGVYGDLVVQLYDHLKRTINIFDVIRTVPHFKAMLQSPIVVENVKNMLALKARTLQEAVNKIYEHNLLEKKTVDLLPGVLTVNKPIISEDNYSKLTYLINDALIVKWLRELDPGRRQFTVPLSKFYKMVDNVVVANKSETPQDITIDLGTSEGRLNFIEFYENTIRDLKNDDRYKNNLFINSLKIDWKKDNLTNNEYKFYRLPINMMSINDYNRGIFDSYITAFNNLGSYIPSTQFTIKDATFLYNLMIHRDRVNRESFTKLFQYDNNFSKDGLMYNYIRSIAEMDVNEDVLKTDQKDADYLIDDVRTKGFGARITENSTRKKQGKYAFAFVRDSEGTLNTKYYQWDEGGNIYRETESYFAEAKGIPLTSNSPLGNERINAQIDLAVSRIRSIFDVLEKHITNLKLNC